MGTDKKKKFPWRRVILSAICVILSVILVLLILVAAYMDRLMALIKREDPNQGTLSSSQLEDLMKPDETREPDYTGPVYNEHEITMPSETVPVIESKNVVNILLIGQDQSAWQERSLSDAMILCSINKENKTLTMTSFLRDTYVKIPGGAANKLNVAYPAGGMDLLDRTLEENFGVRVDGNIVVNFSQFAGIVDLLGGIDIELTNSEAVHLNNEYGYSLKKGMNHLNGEEALNYSRIRKLDSDFGRTNRQRKVLATILDQFRNAPLSQINDAITEILSLITTDMSNAEIMGYVVEFAPMLSELTIASQSIPTDGTYSFGDVADRNIVDCIFINDYEKNLKLLQDVVSGD